MARLITSGFELNSGLQSAAPDGGFSGAITWDTGTVRSGTYSLKCAPVATGAALQWTPFASSVALGNDCFMRAYVYVPTGGLPTAQTTIMALGATGAAAYPYSIRMATDGTLTLWALIGGTTWTQQGSASSAIALDSWNRIDLRGNTGTGSIDACEGRLGGSSFASASGLNVTDSVINQATVGVSTDGLSSPTATVYFDDVAINDSSGAAQTTWPPASNIVLLRPTADSAVGTGWTLGNTTATGGNAWQREDNIPPDSATDLTTTADATQIRNATSNANVNYDATMATYTAAGVTGTVNVVVPIIATGAPVVTSAKAGTVGVVSNPAITNVSLGAGGTSGAFWSGVAMGTYPTGNKWSFGTTTYAPTVTLGTAPVMRVTQVTSSTRIAIVTEMGMYVDYTPAVIIPPTPLVNQSVPFYPRPSRPA